MFTVNAHRWSWSRCRTESLRSPTVGLSSTSPLDATLTLTVTLILTLNLVRQATLSQVAAFAFFPGVFYSTHKCTTSFSVEAETSKIDFGRRRWKLPIATDVTATWSVLRCLSIFHTRAMKPVDGMRSHFAWTLAWFQITQCNKQRFRSRRERENLKSRSAQQVEHVLGHTDM